MNVKVILHKLMRKKTGIQAILITAAILSIGTAFESTDNFTSGVKFFVASLAIFLLSITLGAAVLVRKLERNVILAAVVGILLLDVILLVFSFLIPIPLALNFMLVVAALLAYGYRRRSDLRFWTALSLSPLELMTLIVSLYAGAMWTQENVRGLFLANSKIYSHPWIDVFFHAKCISIFMNASLSDISMSGAPLSPYHYASYMIPATFGVLTETPAYLLATRTLPFLGMVCTGLAAYSLGAVLLKQSKVRAQLAGLFAMASVLLIPDGSYLGLGNRWTSYFFFQQVGVAGCYGVSALAIAWVFAFQSYQSRYESPTNSGQVPHWLSLLIGSLGFCALTALFKVQLALTYAWPLLIFLGSFIGNYTWRVRMLLVLAVVAGCFTVSHFLPQFPRAPTFEFSTLGAMHFLKTIINHYEGATAAWLNQFLPEASSYFRQVAIGLPLLLISNYGIWLTLTCVSFILSLRERLRRGSRIRPSIGFLCFPLFTIGAHCVVGLSLAQNRGFGDPFEVYHKTFVWPYFAICVWNSISIARFFILYWTRTHRLAIYTLAGVFVIGMGLTFYCGKTVESGIKGSNGRMNLGFSQDLFKVIQYLRKNTVKNSVVQSDINDGFLIIAALAEREPYVLQILMSGQRSDEIDRRFQVLDHLLKSNNYSQLIELGRSVNINWLITSPDKFYPWKSDPTAIPAFCSGGYCAFNMGKNSL